MSTRAAWVAKLRSNWPDFLWPPLLFGLGLASTFAGQLTLSHTATATAFGTFVLIYNASALFSGLGAAGFDLSAVRYAALATKDGDASRLALFVRSAVRMVVPVSLLSAGLMTVYLAVTVDIGWRTIAAGALAAFLWSLTRVAAGLLRGIGNLTSALFADRVARDFGVMLLAGGALLAAKQVSAELALGTFALGSAVGLAIGIASWRRSYRSMIVRPLARRSQLPDPAVRRGWLAASLGLMAYNLAELLSSRFDIFALSLLADPAAVGALGVALLLLNLVTIPASFILLLIMPAVAVAHGTNDRSALRRLFALTTTAALTSGLLIAGVIVLALPWFDKLLVSETVSALRIDVLMLAIGVRVLCLAGTFPPILFTMSGRHRTLIAAHGISIALRAACFAAFAAVADANLALLSFTAGTMVVTVFNLIAIVPQLRNAPARVSETNAGHRL